MDSAKSGGEVELAVPGVDRAPLSSPAGSVDRLLHQTAEEEEMEAKGLNTSGEMDFLILDEVKVDEEQEGRSEWVISGLRMWRHWGTLSAVVTATWSQ